MEGKEEAKDKLEIGKQKQELENLYKDFSAVLKFLYWKALQENKETEAKHYDNVRKKIDMIRERRHLTLIGEKGGYKQAYQTMLEIIQSRYVSNREYASEQSIASIEDTINGIEELCEEYEIRGKEEKIQDTER